MTLDWQTIVSVACVAAAALLLARRGVRLFAGRAGCGTGGCGTCPSKRTDVKIGPQQKPFVTLESLEDRPDHRPS